MTTTITPFQQGKLKQINNNNKRKKDMYGPNFLIPNLWAKSLQLNRNNVSQKLTPLKMKEKDWQDLEGWIGWKD